VINASSANGGKFAMGQALSMDLQTQTEAECIPIALLVGVRIASVRTDLRRKTVEMTSRRANS
jgi:hypothetical protein